MTSHPHAGARSGRYRGHTARSALWWRSATHDAWTLSMVPVLTKALRPSRNSDAMAHQLQPLVLPQLGQAWQEPARIIWTPHCMQ
jgi:hypothetical protein